MSAWSSRPVLVVDDTPANLAVLTELLDRAGFEVVVARDGAGALERLRTLQPAIILLDVLMPVLDGYATCRRIKAEPRLADVPVLFLTAQAEAVDRLEGFAAGAVDYITKPFCAEEVLARIRAHLRIRELQEEVAEQLRRREEAEAQLERSLDRAVAVIGPDGVVQFCTLLARAVLDRWFPDGAGPGLPAPVAAWAAARWAGRPGTPAELRVNDERGELTLRLVAGAAAPESALLLLDEQVAASPQALRALGLTPREAEVLFWLTEGKSYREIGIILACEWRTAQKHAENIYQKLHVENRHGAAALARAALDRPAGTDGQSG